MKNYMFIKQRLLLVILLIPASFAGCRAQETQLPFDSEVRKGKLSNGFTYYIRKNSEPKGRAVLYLVNKVGSILETEEQQGLAHFMEHMSFNGTIHFPKNSLVDYLQKAGLKFGADINASTGFDQTLYQLPLPTDDPEILKNGIQILRDWAQEATLEPSEIDKERGVVLEEKRSKKGVQERMQVQTFPMMTNHSLYSKRMPIGTDEVLKNFKPETIRSFYMDWYRPNLQALIVVGDIDVDHMEGMIKAKFSDLKNPVNEKPHTIPVISLTGKNQFLVITDKEITSTAVQVLIKSRMLDLKTISDYRRNMVQQLFSSMLRERFNELNQNKSAALISGGASLSEFLGGLNTLTISAGAKSGGLENAFKEVWREIVRIKKFGFNESELTRAKINYQSMFDAMSREKDKINSEQYAQEYVAYFMSDVAAPGLDYETQLVAKELPSISLQNINDFSLVQFKDVDRDVILMAPEKEKETLPDEARFNSWMKLVEAENLQPKVDPENNNPLLMKMPVPGKIVSEERDAALNITRLSLSNGIKVILKPTEFQNNAIYFGGFAFGGANLYPESDFQSASSAAGIIGSFGVGNLSSLELGKYLTGKELQVRTGMSESMRYVNGGASLKDLPTALELLYGYFTQPRRDEHQFENILNGARANLSNRSDDPMEVFQDTISAVLSGYHPHRTAPSLQKLDQLSLNRMYEIYKEQFGDAAGFTFTFVGSFKIDSIKPLLERYIAALPTNGRIAKARPLDIHIPEGRIEKTVYKGKEDKASVLMVFSGLYDYNATNGIELDALKEVILIRLTERLRETEGGVYSPSVSNSFSKIPVGRYSITISFTCSPENVERLIKSAQDEINKLKTTGPAKVDVDKVVAEGVRHHETQARTNGWWIGYIDHSCQTGEPLRSPGYFVTTLKKTTPTSIKQAANKYLSGKNFVKMVLMPEPTR